MSGQPLSLRLPGIFFSIQTSRCTSFTT